jgi:chaperone modulatory protein CbpM
MDMSAFLLHARLDAEVLETWIGAGWVMPRRESEAPLFSEIDVARVQLIRELREDMGVNDEGIAIILDLVDQIHGLRCALREVCSALDAQPESVRRRIRAGIRDAASQETGGRAGEKPSR